LKLFAVVRYGPNGQPIKFLSHSANNWQAELDRNCLWHEKDKVEKLAGEVDGFVEVYNVEREMPKVYREAPNLLSPHR
jgi:hypothetical protein